MPKVAAIQANFEAGEVSPLTYGRVDSPRYKAALAKCENWIPTLQGGLTRRPGGYYIGEVKDSSKATRLVSFEYSTTQAYVIEFGDSYCRFYKDQELITLASKTITAATKAFPTVITAAAHGYSIGDRVVIGSVNGMTQLNNREFQIGNTTTDTFEIIDPQTSQGIDSTLWDTYTSGGTVAKVYEVSSAYAEADLFNLKFTQSADVLYITHPSYAPKKLTRASHTSWTFTTITFLDGPYLPQNSTTTTFTPSAATVGTGRTITASAITGINGDHGFQTGDVGRFIRIKQGSTWGYCQITALNSTTIAVVTIINAFVDTSAVTTWRMGLWGTYAGFPSCSSFHEDRLFFGGSAQGPATAWGSRTSDYENFAPTDADGTVSDNHSVGFSVVGSEANTIRWLSSDERGLLVGTSGNEWIVKPAAITDAMSPTNIIMKRCTRYGSNNVAPIQVGKATLFLQNSGRKLREMTYFYDVDGFRATDLSLLSEHITGTGVLQMAHHREPQSIVFGVRNDGQLCGLSYERETDVLRAGWSRHIFGGQSDLFGSDPIAKSVAAIPADDGSRTELWVIVERWIQNRVAQYIEVLQPLFDENTDQKQAYFVDCGLTYDNPITITDAAIVGAVITVTAAAHGFSNGDHIAFDGFEWEGNFPVFTNGYKYTISNVTTNTFDVTPNFLPFGSTSLSDGGVVRKYVSTVSGLNHLEGSTVQICADGAIQEEQVVLNGKITLAFPATVIHVGFTYDSDGQRLRDDSGAANGTAMAKKRRTHVVGFLFYLSCGFKFGMDFTDMDEIDFRNASDNTDQATPLFSGIKKENIPADYDFDNQLAFRVSDPFPCTLNGIYPQLDTQDAI